MNRILMSTVSAVAVAAFASPAMAQLELDVSAYYYFQAGIVDDDSAGGGDDWDFQNEGWVQFNGRGTADNGLTYGFRLDLDDVASNIDVEVDETYLFVQGGFGTVTLGDDDHAADDIAVTVPTAGSGILDGDFSDYTDGGDVLVTFLPEGNTDSTKVKYTSTGAELGGFTVGLSYAPDSGSEGDDLARVNGTPAGDFENVVSAGARYSGDFQGFSVSVGAVGYLGDAVAPGAWRSGRSAPRPVPAASRSAPTGRTMATPAVTASCSERPTGPGSGPWPATSAASRTTPAATTRPPTASA